MARYLVTVVATVEVEADDEAHALLIAENDLPDTVDRTVELVSSDPEPPHYQTHDAACLCDDDDDAAWRAFMRGEGSWRAFMRGER